MIETPLGTVRFSGSPSIGPFTPSLPLEYPPVTARVAVWRLAGPQPDVTLSAWLTGLPPDAEGGGDSGERLAAMTFESPTAAMSFGGPDIEMVHAYTGRYLPSRWASLVPEDEWPEDRYSVAIGDTMIVWHLPDLREGESLTLCALVAWGAPTEEPATWFAVDANTEQVLRQV